MKRGTVKLGSVTHFWVAALAEKERRRRALRREADGLLGVPPRPWLVVGENFEPDRARIRFDISAASPLPFDEEHEAEYQKRLGAWEHIHRRRRSPEASAATKPRYYSYLRPHLYEKQLAAIFAGERIALIEASTKSGKTLGCLVWIWEQVLLKGRPGRSWWWVAPVYGQALIAYRRLKRALPRDAYVFNDGELSIEAPNGGRVEFKTAEKPDNLYGEDVFGAVIDEASRIREDSWTAVQTTLLATRGDVRIIGNVKGKLGWFYKLSRRAEAGEDGMHYSRITYLDAINAGILDPKTVDELRRVISGRRASELLDAVPGKAEGALWDQDWIDSTRGRLLDDPAGPNVDRSPFAPAGKRWYWYHEGHGRWYPVPDFRRVVVAIDPAGSTAPGADDTGIVVVGHGTDDRYYVLADLTCHLHPAGWGARAIGAYRHWLADKIIDERNFGGDMVASTILAIDPNVPVKDVIASRGKEVRAEPISVLYENGKVTHLSRSDRPGIAHELEMLEDELTSWEPGEDKSPNRLDALVFAMTELALHEPVFSAVIR